MNLSPEIYPTAIRMIIVLIIFLLCMLTIFYLSKKVLKKGSKENGSNYIKIIESKYVGLKKSITLIYVPNKILILGISNEKINLLSEIKDKNIIDELVVKNEEKQNLFYKNLQKWSTKLKNAR